MNKIIVTKTPIPRALTYLLGLALFSFANAAETSDFTCDVRVYQETVNELSNMDDILLVEKINFSAVYANEIDIDRVVDRIEGPVTTRFLPKVNLYASVRLTAYPLTSLNGSVYERVLYMRWFLHPERDLKSADAKTLITGGSAIYWDSQILMTRKNFRELVALVVQRISDKLSYSYQLSCSPSR
ncbi:MAG: hypothetical protein K2X47_14665 [Bdellovibrionales bacterium]|nr:hypothetical protein [Bdellovibrionales bacterium]